MDAKSSKQTTKSTTMPKEASANSGSKVKLVKSPKEDHTPHKEQDTNSNQKRDASTRSPLDGNPSKKQKEYKETEVFQMMEQNSLWDTEISINDNKSSTNSITPNPTENEDLDMHHPDKDGNPSLSTPLLQELKEIKHTLLNLNTKIEISHQDLLSRMIDNKEMKELLTAQNDKIAMQIIKLEKEALEAQEEVLRLKVDFSRINEGTYESYDQLRSKIAEVMVPTCEGSTEEDKWNTSTGIPIIDCQHLGTYNRNKKRVVRVTFLYMKHKSCLLSRKRNLPRGIYVDEVYPDIIKKKSCTLTNTQTCTQYRRIQRKMQIRQWPVNHKRL